MFSLGILGHDGDNDNKNCSTDDQYIMAGKILALNANNFQNTFRFSSCSIEWMRKVLFNRLIIIIIIVKVDRMSSKRGLNKKRLKFITST